MTNQLSLHSNTSKATITVRTNVPTQPSCMMMDFLDCCTKQMYDTLTASFWSLVQHQWNILINSQFQEQLCPACKTIKHQLKQITLTNLWWRPNTNCSNGILHSRKRSCSSRVYSPWAQTTFFSNSWEWAQSHPVCSSSPHVGCSWVGNRAP